MNFERIEMSFSALEIQVIRWLEDRRIIQNSTVEAQFLKTVSEIGELADCINKGDIDGIKDAIGDVTVTLLAVAAILDIDFTDCLEHAYNEIKDRRGVLMPNGVFVKD